MARAKAADYEIAPILEHLGAVAVPRVGRNGYAKMRCPFHDDTHPSATVSRYGFRCWSCGVSGDTIKLLREQKGMSFADAVKLTKELTGGPDSAKKSLDWGDDLFS